MGPRTVPSLLFIIDLNKDFPKTPFASLIKVDPGFTSACNEFYLVHILSDLFRYAKNIKAVKILASQTGLKVAEFSLMLELNKVKENVRKLEEVVFLSPYKMHGQGITHQLAMWFLTNCPNLRFVNKE